MRTTWKKIKTETKRGGSNELSRFFVCGEVLNGHLEKALVKPLLFRPAVIVFRFSSAPF